MPVAAYRHPHVRRAAALVFLLTLSVYVAGLCPGPYWLDSSEFAVASAVLGVAHPPGHPLALLLGKAASLLPLGPVALRVGFAQALCAAAAAGLLCLLGARLGARAAEAVGGAPGALPPLGLALLGAGAALGTSLGYAVAFQAVRPEVYALHRLLAAAALLGAALCDEEDGRGLPLLAMSLGLALANHHFLALLLCLPAPLLLRRSHPGGPLGLLRPLGLPLCLGALGLLLYAYLPLRAAHHPLVNWGSPTTLSRLFWVVSARAFQKSVKAPEGDDADVIGALVEQAGPVYLLLALVGLYLLLRQRPTRRLGAYLLAVVALHGAGRAALGFDVANPDAHGYLVPAGDALALLGCAGLGGLLGLAARLRQRRGPLPGTALAALALLSAVAWGARELPRSLRAGFFDVDLLVGGWLAEAPPRARLLSSHFQSVFALWYLQGVEGQRPDVEHIHPHFLPNPGHREDLRLRFQEDPELVALLGGEGEAGLRVPALLAAASRRPTLLEYDVDTPDALVAALRPAGLGERLSPAAPRAAAAPSQARRERLLVALDLEEPETRRNVLWRSYLHAQLACRAGDGESLAAELRRARALLRGAASPEFDELERRCR